MTLDELRALDPGGITPAEIDFLDFAAKTSYAHLRLEQLDALTVEEAALIRRHP